MRKDRSIAIVIIARPPPKKITLEVAAISRTRDLLRALDSNTVRLSGDRYRESTLVSNTRRDARLFIDNHQRKRAYHFTNPEGGSS